MKINILAGLGAVLIATAMPCFGADCSSGSSPAEVRACFAEELKSSDGRLNAIYSQLMSSSPAQAKESLKHDERDWIKQRDEVCHLDPASDRDAWLNGILADQTKTICVVDITRSRIATLEKIQAPPAGERDPYKEAFDRKPPTTHASGKWYFEVTIDPAMIAQISPTTFAVGLSDKSNLTGTMENISAEDIGKQRILFGIAADLDNGKLYLRKNGEWIRGLPGSNQGQDLKLGRDYYAVFMVSAKKANQQYLDSGAIRPNYGDQPPTEALPDGYLPWRGP
ncbi:lysozyme inhibitor LprI family protein [Nevskia soli]|uniref:lysozyme inhibitor LprI family protein n=1 Tax=Nevskia soli TaxID=418856 RepID=UPI0004A6B4FA|nr:lysozyme inhibitor LprI family protein [Nevskia soli]